jgi:hypothetical protein
MSISSTNRVKAARVLGVVADAVQLGLLPLFVGGWVSPLNDALDVVVGIAMVALVGWHWAFVPAFFSEMIPVWDLVPSWTAAVLIATRNAPVDVTAQGTPPAGPKSLDAAPAPRALKE